MRAKGTKQFGQWVGPHESFHDNGQLWKKGTYVDGEWDGPHEFYRFDGELLEKGIYEKGKKCGQWMEKGKPRHYELCVPPPPETQEVEVRTEDSATVSPPSSQSTRPSVFDDLKKLSELKGLGVLTDEEFERKKQELLDGI